LKLHSADASVFDFMGSFLMLFGKTVSKDLRQFHGPTGITHRPWGVVPFGLWFHQILINLRWKIDGKSLKWSVDKPFVIERQRRVS